ncbi:MAG TPA: hypothetical protein VK395_01715 [Gemmataceae bacterium]|nr:hypothetical protein [Gemmataceae bacterium]
MKLQHFLAALALVAFLPAKHFAVDLSKIERVIAKEPPYRFKPKYCLLVFGPEATTRLWLVQDGDTLYVDRNGNGDLTEAGKKVAARRWDGADEGEYKFEIGDVQVGERLHKRLSVTASKLDSIAAQDDLAKAFLDKNPRARGYQVLVELEIPGKKGTGIGGRVPERAFYVDVNGVLQFADRAQDAPIIHFDGPLQVTFFGRQQLTIDREADLVLGVGSPGIGPGTTTFIDYEGLIPAKAYPVVEVTYLAKSPHDPPVRERYELKRGC